jgi:hypothetical protein
MDPLLFIILGVLFFIVRVLIDLIAGESKRVRALKKFAVANRWAFSPDERYSMKSSFPKVALFIGKDSYKTSNVMRRKYSGLRVTICDYEYTTSNGKNEQTFSYTCYILQLPVSFGWLNVTRESLRSKIAQAFGYDDIDFESAEFSRRYCVRAQNRKEAYALITPQMMDYLMATPGLYFSIQGSLLLITFDGQLEARHIPQRVNLLFGIAARIPGYLLTQKNNAWTRNE